MGAPMKRGFGKCSDCAWFNDPEGCNVERDSPVCLLNKRPRKNKETVITFLQQRYAKIKTVFGS